MEKIKINMMSGSSLEKPLVSAFKSNNAVYVVLDNEINGTMGLPIILVSKLENNKLSKIVDQNEWGAVKETLRMIIAGNQVDYVVVDGMLSADDMFFSQLTLPVASFDALKNNYRPNFDNAGTNVTSMDNNTLNESVMPQTPVAPVAPEVTPTPVDNTNVVDTTMQSPVTPAPMENVGVAPMETVTPTLETAAPVSPEMPAAPVSGYPENAQNVTPVMPSAPVESQNVAPVTEMVMPETPLAADVQPIPVQEPVSTPTPVDFTADKEAFLKACENMFDALVAKFKN